MTRALDRLAPQRINAPWGEHRVDEQRLVAARALDIGGKAVIEESAERIHLVPCDGQPRRHRMAAAGDEQSRFLRGEDRGAQTAAADRPPRPLAYAVRVHRAHDRGAEQFFFQASGDAAAQTGRASCGERVWQSVQISVVALY